MNKRFIIFVDGYELQFINEKDLKRNFHQEIYIKAQSLRIGTYTYIGESGTLIIRLRDEYESLRNL